MRAVYDSVEACACPLPRRNVHQEIFVLGEYDAFQLRGSVQNPRVRHSKVVLVLLGGEHIYPTAYKTRYDGSVHAVICVDAVRH